MFVVEATALSEGGPMYLNELLAIAKQNELREHAEHARLVRQARIDRAGILARGFNAVRSRIRDHAAPSADPANRERPILIKQ
jgi:hypothetical protein